MKQANQAAALREWRRERKLTQAAMCAMLNNTPISTYKDWESGRRNPPVMLWALLKKLD